MSMNKIKTKVENGVAILSIDRPEALNALSREIVDEIDQFISDLGDDVRVLLVYSEKNFAAGADIKGMVNCGEAEAREFSFSPTYNKLAALNIPTIAAIDGYALGGGLELALACDLRFASERAKMGFPEISLGIMPGAGGTILAARCIGISAAMEMIFSGNSIDAQQAAQLGLVNRVVPSDALFTETLAFAEKLARRAPIALQTAKQTILAGSMIPRIDDAIALESENWARLFATTDQKEGMNAFLEKRKPYFKGC